MVLNVILKEGPPIFDGGFRLLPMYLPTLVSPISMLI